jgi:hypothetical protein
MCVVSEVAVAGELVDGLEGGGDAETVAELIQVAVDGVWGAPQETGGGGVAAFSDDGAEDLQFAGGRRAGGKGRVWYDAHATAAVSAGSSGRPAHGLPWNIWMHAIIPPPPPFVTFCSSGQRETILVLTAGKVLEPLPGSAGSGEGLVCD